MSNIKFDTFGVMVDVSRNAVMTVDALKRFMDDLHKMGYNMLMLYTEDTYEVEGEAYFGYMRGKYTVEEMRALDEYGASLGIELIPCMQTLAHMNAYLRWGKTPVDTGDIMLVGDERTYTLIDRMFKTLSECFRTRRIHIGMDEAQMLGRGRYLNLHGYEDAHLLLRRHLERVLAIAAKYGYTTMVWSDMFFRPWNKNAYYIPKKEIPKEYKEALPAGVLPVFWDYYHTTETEYDDMMYNHRQLSEDFWFAGAVWTGNGYMPHGQFSLDTMLPAFRMAQKHGVKNVFLTMWADGGGECSRLSLLAPLFYLSEVAKGNTDETSIKSKFREMFDASYDDFLLLDLPDSVCGEEKEPYTNVSKYALLADTFNGWTDYTVEANAAYRFAEATDKLLAAERRNPKYRLLFKKARLLSSALAVKYDLGQRVRAAYKANDKEALSVIAKEDYPTAIRRVRAFARVIEESWLSENKPQGLDIQQIRLCGVAARLDYCRRTLSSYLAGKLALIEELETEILPMGQKGKSGIIRSAGEIMSPSVP